MKNLITKLLKTSVILMVSVLSNTAITSTNGSELDSASTSGGETQRIKFQHALSEARFQKVLGRWLASIMQKEKYQSSSIEYIFWNEKADVYCLMLERAEKEATQLSQKLVDLLKTSGSDDSKAGSTPSAPTTPTASILKRPPMVPTAQHAPNGDTTYSTPMTQSECDAHRRAAEKEAEEFEERRRAHEEHHRMAQLAEEEGITPTDTDTKNHQKKHRKHRQTQMRKR